MNTSRVAILGLGLIGGSIGSALRRVGWEVHGYDISERAASTAVARGLVDHAASQPAFALHHADVVVLALPVLSSLQVLTEIDDLAPAGTLVIDTGSVKGPVVERMEGLRRAERAIGGHPLAGTEHAGPEWSDADIFRGRPFVLTPSRRTSESTVAAAIRFVHLLGANPVVPVDAERHDRALAGTSHLPQILSTALAITVDPDDYDLSGPALQTMARVAGSDPAMWRDILLANGDNVANAIEVYAATLQRMSQMIRAKDGHAIMDAMERGRDAYRRMEATFRS